MSQIINSVKFKVLVDSSEMSAGSETSVQSAENMSTGFGKARDSLNKFGTDAIRVGSGLTAAITVPIFLLARKANTAFLDFDRGMAGVKKTVDMTAYEIQRFEDDIRKMALALPMDVVAITKIAEVAGQLGVKSEHIRKFTDTMAKLEISTNLTGEEAAFTLAQFANITKLDLTQVDRLGATLVNLGNNSATTEKDIMNMSKRIAGAATTAGMSQADILGLATGLASMGIKVESGGTSMSKFINNLSMDISTGGKNVKKFAEISGVSVDQFKKNFENNASQTIVDFVKGLQKIRDAGGDVNTALSDLGIKETRMVDMFLRASGNAADLQKYLDLSKESWEENLALENEVAKKNDTAEAKRVRATNMIKDSLITIGGLLDEYIADKFEFIAKKIHDVVEKFKKLGKPEPKEGEVEDKSLSPEQENILNGVGLVAAVGPALVIIGTIAKALAGLQGIFAAVGTAIGSIGGGGVVLLTVAAVAALVAILKGAWDNSEKLRETLTEVFKAIKLPTLEDFKNIVKNIKDAFDFFVTPEMLELLGDAIARMIEAFIKIKPVLDVIFQVIGGVLMALIGVISFVVYAFVLGFTGILEGIARTIDFVVSMLIFFWETFSGAINIVVSMLIFFWETFKDTIDLIVGVIWEMLIGIGETIFNIFLGIKDFIIKIIAGDIPGAFQSLLTTVVNVVQSIFSTIQNIFGRILTFMGNGINNVAALATRIFGDSVNTLIKFANNFIGGFIKQVNGAIGIINAIPGVHIDLLPKFKIPLMADGGTFSSGTAIVGEAGAELLSLKNGVAQVTPLTSGQAKSGLSGLGGSQTIINFGDFNIEGFIGNKSDLVREITDGIDRRLGGVIYAK